MESIGDDFICPTEMAQAPAEMAQKRAEVKVLVSHVKVVDVNNGIQ